MSRKLMIATLGALSAINLAVLIINMSSPLNGAPSNGAPSKGAPLKGAAGTTKYQQFIRDPDFNRAVRDIVQECNVNVDLAKLEC
jgi:hypothetical protein